MVTGAPFQAGIPISAADLNSKTITHTDSLGTEPKVPGQIFYNIANNGAFLKDEVVAWNADGDGFNYLTMGKHTHDDDTNRSGGSFRDIIKGNLARLIWFNKITGLNIGDFLQLGTGGSTTLDTTTGSMKLDTSTSSNNYRNSQLHGIPFSYAEYAVMQTRMQFTAVSTNVFVRWGAAMENMGVSNDSDRKFGIESCAATNGNWFVVTADGSSRTQSDSLKPLLGGSTDQSYKIENNVGVSVDFTYASDSAVSKTTNLPTTSSPPTTNIVNYGVKTSNTTGKQLYVWGLVLVALKDESYTKWI